MAQESYKLRRVRAAVEPNGAHGTEISIGSFIDIAFREDSWKKTLGKPMETPMLIQQHLHGYPEKVFGPRSWDASVSVNMRAAPAVAGNAVIMANVPDAPLLEVCLGGVFLGTGTTIASTSTTTVLNLTNAAGLREGCAIGLNTGAGGAFEARVIKTIATNVVTLHLALSSVPSNGSTVYASATYFLGATNGGNIKSLQLTDEGAPDADRWLMRGGQIKSPPKFTVTPGKISTIGFELHGTEFNRADGTNGVTMNLTGVALANQNYTSGGINVAMDSELRIHQVGVSTLAGTLIQAQEIEITPNIKVVPHTTIAGLNTVFQWVPARPDGPACTIGFALPYDASTWRTLRDNKTQMRMTCQLGSSTTTGAVLLDVPRLGFDDFQLEEVGEISGQRIKGYGFLDNTGTGGGTTDLGVSVFRYNVFGKV